MSKSSNEKQKFSDAKAYLDDLKRIEEAAEKDKMRVCDWADPEDYVTWRRLDNQQNRTQILDRLVPDRKCSWCERIWPGMRSWVINKEKTQAICRSCYFRHLFNDKDVRKDVYFMNVNLFEKTLRYKIDGVKLRFSRKHIDMTQEEFGRSVEWNSQYQGFLECGRRLSVNEQKMSLIMSVFEQMVKEDDDEAHELVAGIIKEVEERYLINHVPLRAARMIAGVSQAELSRRIGCRSAMMHTLEAGKVKTINKVKKNRILSVFYNRYKIRTRDFPIT